MHVLREKLQDVSRILIIKPSSLGDIVHALPVLAALRKAKPDAYIAWLTATPFVPLLDQHPLIDEIIAFDRKAYGKMHRSPRVVGDFVGFLRDLRLKKFDLVIDLQGLYRSGFFSFVSRAKRRIGFAKTREFASLHYTERVACPDDVTHAVDRNMCIAAALGLDARQVEFPLGIRDEEVAAAKTLIDETAKQPLANFTAIVPGARWATKQWKTAHFASLIDQLQADGFPPCILFGSPDETPVSAEIKAKCTTPVIDLTGKTTLRGLTACLSLADQVICNDSGPMHIAAAMDKPIVAVFGPTDPDKCGPYTKNATVVRHPINCKGCYERQCSHTTCMNDLGPSMVYDAVVKQRNAMAGESKTPVALPTTIREI